MAWAWLGDEPLLVVGEVGVDDDQGPADVGRPGIIASN
jgi:hypothetical protein